MKIADNLNLTIPLRADEKGTTVHGYHTPISREVFAENYRILAATKASLASKGVHYLMGSGPRIAALTLRDEGKKDALDRGDVDASGKPSDGGAKALLEEIKRLTVILCPSASGWTMLPIDAAISQGVIDEDDWQEGESAIVFFTAHWALASKAEKAKVANATASALKGSITSSSATEFIGSLPTSTSSATTAAKAVSSVPC